MADILTFQTPHEPFHKHFVAENLPDRPTQDIINDLKPLRMLGEEDAPERSILFAELAVKTERGMA